MPKKSSSNKKTNIPLSKASGTILKFNAVKEFISSRKFRSDDSAIMMLVKSMDETIIAVVTEAQTLAQSAKRSTILDEDIQQALEKHLGKKHLTWQELAQEIILQNPTDLGSISKSINDYIQKQKG